MGKSVLYRVYLAQTPHKHQVCHEYGISEHPPALRTLQAAAMGQADRNVGKVSGRAEFYQRLKALSVAPVKEPTKGQAVIVGVPKIETTGTGPFRITAIKALRELTSLGLKEAKDAIDCVDGRCYVVPQANYHFPITDIETANRQAKVMREAGCTVQVNLS